MSLASAIQARNADALPGRRDEDWRWTDLRGLIRMVPEASAPIAQQIPQVTQPALTVIPAAAQPTQPSYQWMLVLALVIILAGVTYFILARRRKSSP